MTRIFNLAAALSLLVLVGACGANRESLSTQQAAPSAQAAAALEAVQESAADPAARAGAQDSDSERDRNPGALARLGGQAIDSEWDRDPRAARGGGEEQTKEGELAYAQPGRETRDEGRAEPNVAPLVPAFPQRKSGAHPAGLETVYFGFDRSELSQDAKRMLTAHAAWLRERPHVNLRLEGNCDERGTSEYNLALGWRRANLVRDFLIAEGVAPEALTSISFGEEVPARRGSDESAWKLNRRVDFSLPDPSQKISSARPPALESAPRGG